jgi:hypothetical protein
LKTTIAISPYLPIPPPAPRLDMDYSRHGKWPTLRHIAGITTTVQNTATVQYCPYSLLKVSLQFTQFKSCHNSNPICPKSDCEKSSFLFSWNLFYNCWNVTQHGNLSDTFTSTSSVFWTRTPCLVISLLTDMDCCWHQILHTYIFLHTLVSFFKHKS